MRIDGPDRWHRADVLAADGCVVELQHSAISPEDIRKRETFYREHAPGIVWIFDYTDRPAEWQTRRDLRLDHSTGSRLVDLGDGLAGHVVGLAGQHRDGNGARMSFGGWSLAEIAWSLRERGVAWLLNQEADWVQATDLRRAIAAQTRGRS